MRPSISQPCRGINSASNSMSNTSSALASGSIQCLGTKTVSSKTRQDAQFPPANSRTV
ncbi:uncharacterized protein J3R85_017457 [Psidium guajava]|nr:uncharacterized protein J3R85_017457 [Psidium guajava]